MAQYGLQNENIEILGQNLTGAVSLCGRRKQQGIPYRKQKLSHEPAWICKGHGIFPAVAK